MSSHRKSYRLAKKLPVAKRYIAEKENLEESLRFQSDEIIGLKQAVERLEARNEEWAEEVRQLRKAPSSLSIVWPVAQQDIIKAKPVKSKTKVKTKPPFTLNWVIPPMGQSSGGHTDIFRIIGYLENQGHKCNVYIYDPLNSITLETVKDYLKNYPKFRGKIYHNSGTIEPADAIFATSWHTAYPVALSKIPNKYYFVQDFEPYFDPIGTYSTLADNTYKFGLRGITLGQWLSKKLSTEYKMECDYIDFGVDLTEYSLINKKPRKKVLFYARPVTPRRGFELGVLALEIFSKQHPEYEIHLLGWDITPYKIPFKYVNHGILPANKLNDLYNECAAGLVLSFTNMSLLPLELMASGCQPVINEAVHTKMSSYAEKVVYTPTNPQAIADALYKAASLNDANNMVKLSKQAQKFTWPAACSTFEKILTKDLSN